MVKTASKYLYLFTGRERETSLDIEEELLGSCVQFTLA